MVRILFYGDPHGNWKPLLKACADDQPDGVVILGDCDLVRPLSAEVAPLLKAGIPLYWIAGNHDSDREEWFANLFQGGVDTNLNGRVVDVGGVRIGGLGGIFQEAIWHPELGSESHFRAPAHYVEHLARQNLLDGRERLSETAIFPDIYDNLANLSADVLVTHDAPSCHRHGFEELDILAEAMGVRLIVHGHHHEAYEAKLESGIQVIGVNRAQPKLIEISR